MYEYQTFKDVSEKDWNFAVKYLNGNYFYSHEYLEYFNYLNLTRLKNKSFIIKENGKVLSLTPLIIFDTPFGLEASFAGNPINFSLINQFQDREKTNELISQIFIKLNEILINLKVKKIFIRSPHYLELNDENFYKKLFFENNFNLIKNEKFLSLKSNLELILDLKDDIRLRKKHSSYVNYTNEKTKIQKITKNDFNENLFEKYSYFHNLHKKNKRSKINFDYNKSLILKGMQNIFLCLLNEEIINSVVIVNFNNKAHYNSSINKIIDKKIYGNFVLLNEAINFYKLRNFSQFYLGDIIDELSLKNNNFSNKELSLSRFKNNWKGSYCYFNNYVKFY